MIKEAFCKPIPTLLALLLIALSALTAGVSVWWCADSFQVETLSSLTTSTPTTTQEQITGTPEHQSKNHVSTSDRVAEYLLQYIELESSPIDLGRLYVAKGRTIVEHDIATNKERVLVSEEDVLPILKEIKLSATSTIIGEMFIVKDERLVFFRFRDLNGYAQMKTDLWYKSRETGKITKVNAPLSHGNTTRVFDVSVDDRYLFLYGASGPGGGVLNIFDLKEQKVIHEQGVGALAISPLGLRYAYGRDSVNVVRGADIFAHNILISSISSDQQINEHGAQFIGTNYYSYDPVYWIDENHLVYQMKVYPRRLPSDTKKDNSGLDVTLEDSDAYYHQSDERLFIYDFVTGSSTAILDETPAEALQKRLQSLMRTSSGWARFKDFGYYATSEDGDWYLINIKTEVSGVSDWYLVHKNNPVKYKVTTAADVIWVE